MKKICFFCLNAYYVISVCSEFWSFFFLTFCGEYGIGRDNMTFRLLLNKWELYKKLAFKDLFALSLFYIHDIEHGTDAWCMSHIIWSTAQEIKNNDKTFKGTDVVLTQLFANT